MIFYVVIFLLILCVLPNKKIYFNNVIKYNSNNAIINYYFYLKQISNLTTIFEKNDEIDKYTEIIKHSVIHYFLFDFLKNFQNFNKIINDPNVQILCHGNGQDSKLAFLLASTTNCTVHSIDPLINFKLINQFYLPNLKFHKMKIEDFNLELCRNKFVIVLGIHSHVDLPDLFKNLRSYASTILIFSLLCHKSVRQCIFLKPIINIFLKELPNKNHLLAWFYENDLKKYK